MDTAQRLHAGDAPTCILAPQRDRADAHLLAVQQGQHVPADAVVALRAGVEAVRTGQRVGAGGFQVEIDHVIDQPGQMNPHIGANPDGFAWGAGDLNRDYAGDKAVLLTIIQHRRRHRPHYRCLHR
jgi:hypothetical protein